MSEKKREYIFSDVVVSSVHIISAKIVIVYLLKDDRFFVCGWKNVVVNSYTMNGYVKYYGTYQLPRILEETYFVYKNFSSTNRNIQTCSQYTYINVFMDH